MPYEYDLSDYAATFVLNWIFHSAATPTPPTSVQLSLHTQGGPALDGTNANEVSDDDTGYERLVVATDPASEFNAVSIVDGWRRVVNSDVLDFGEATDVWHDGSNLVDTIAVWDMEATPNLLFRVQMDPGREINPGPVQISAETFGLEM